ncbi:MAG: hypothetical protein H8E26_14195 [FCB group bacterium]|nr:hypothetical protein [FCB group bacterium]MBL7027435.1 hypothetical protein [Candidatus Neomarinimicrobiota bacterium]
MNTIVEKQANRALFIHRLYELTDGDTDNLQDLVEIGSSLGFTSDESYRIVQYLDSEGLVEELTVGGGIVITHQGVKEMENSIQKPDTPTEHFEPYNMIVNYGTIINSQIQQGTDNSSISTQSSDANLSDLSPILDEILELLKTGDIQEDRADELRSDIDTLAAQIASPKPKLNIVKLSLQSLNNIVKTAQLALKPEMIELVQKLIEKL